MPVDGEFWLANQKGKKLPTIYLLSSIQIYGIILLLLLLLKAGHVVVKTNVGYDVSQYFPTLATVSSTAYYLGNFGS